MLITSAAASMDAGLPWMSSLATFVWPSSFAAGRVTGCLRWWASGWSRAPAGRRRAGSACCPGRQQRREGVLLGLLLVGPLEVGRGRLQRLGQRDRTVAECLTGVVALLDHGLQPRRQLDVAHRVGVELGHAELVVGHRIGRGAQRVRRGAQVLDDDLEAHGQRSTHLRGISTT
ncbi:hypothetical protein [Nocardioides sp.]|uniref:hypothetical protein n=1 Tax=Nocardioides sp. TaxID=35761 RepID=UPI0035292FA0